MTTIALLILAALAGVAGIWPMAIAAVVLALLAGGVQSVDDAVTEDAAPVGIMRPLALLALWVLIGIAGAVVLFVAVGVMI